MSMLPFDKPGRFFRGNLHCHSTGSDGLLSPADTAAFYRERGFDFVAITDHWGWPGRFTNTVTDTRSLRREDFTTLLGAELHAPATSQGILWHIVASGLPGDFAHVADEGAPELAARAAAAGAFVVLAHPEASVLTVEDAESIPAAHALEIWSGGPGWDGRHSGGYLLDALMVRGRRISVVASDDAHFGDRGSKGEAWTMVRAESLEPEALVAALRAGHSYASQGPELHDVAIDGDSLRISCSPAEWIYVNGANGVCAPAPGPGLTEHEVELEQFGDRPLRVTVVDADGKRAWTNPLWAR
ncbi:CehA/McbA family metallohydrolase [Conexibacter sp. JD483]|uniref:CehA/McbA family metallohydrolase n=1 Tax=unclassified Conexibacter TaxID=2627773 RepID=UPI002723D2B2|nr:MULTISPECIES: CehA/McbA family metallohydrolase [unclassified Conexibacter]MDO8189044.1 CehA/McbA family metallohydrolase [Conexibacter sp. CPCC 205706]MDO8198515.1 CehA/McbA family metallohydrolase [Conexibacter sp. CPCC 205762]MDR9367601.1 CehA/McbA family metallohydrolase [Conexibacter sp. JD483]